MARPTIYRPVIQAVSKSIRQAGRPVSTTVGDHWRDGPFRLAARENRKKARFGLRMGNLIRKKTAPRRRLHWVRFVQKP